MDAAAITLPNLRSALASMETLLEETVCRRRDDEPGLFAPSSISWEICREPAYGISALAGLLMAALHPSAMAAIDQHSDYRRDAWRRAYRTTEYVFTITFGSADAARAAADRVRRIHRAVVGTEPLSGRGYRADDHDLLLWVHCVNTDTALRGQIAFARALTSSEQDFYVAEQAAAARLVGLPEALIPRSVADLRAALATVELRLSPAASEFFQLLMRARMPPTMRPFWALHIWGAAMILPDRVRSIYGFPGWLPSGRAPRTGVYLALKAMDFAYGLFPRVRRVRRRLAAMRAHSEQLQHDGGGSRR